jgi:tryptophanyl-tRNA synthetase
MLPLTPQPRLLSGIKPTGDIHIGNYFGAMRQWVDLQGRYETIVGIMDLHALTQIHEPSVLSVTTGELIKAYLAVGLDPQKVTLFQQSSISAHAELCWIFNCISSMGMLERGHAYKDAMAKDRSINVGVFDYPILMAADILLYKPEIVPVGKDQQQHVEVAIDIAQRFNHLFGETFLIPKVLILEGTAVVPGTDGRKMSKSYGNVIGLFDAPEVIRKKVAGIVTDSKRPEEPKDPAADTLFALHSLVGGDMLSEIRRRYLEGGIGYKESKDILSENLIRFLAPIQEKKRELDADPSYVEEILENGRMRALSIAESTLKEVKERTGLVVRF